MNNGKQITLAETEREIMDEGVHKEGGEILFLHIFGKTHFRKLNFKDMCFILKISNWELEYQSFRKMFNLANIPENELNTVIAFESPNPKDWFVESAKYASIEKDFTAIGRCINQEKQGPII